ncbi:hypothetical protein Pmani_033664 [Petrolisthes manimaculis]|uniref:Uncharacterized protein n=1 Tax=Petrolisthes manimaculis TaxID=1843537 RepID=A0AAE1NQK5_9EUCA|nr:hypothetical protein Pmani_033664 [Petrolisthes manimaculis]
MEATNFLVDWDGNKLQSLAPASRLDSLLNLTQGRSRIREEANGRSESDSFFDFHWQLRLGGESEESPTYRLSGVNTLTHLTQNYLVRLSAHDVTMSLYCR